MNKSNLPRFVLLLALTLLFIGPFYWLAVTSFSSGGEVFAFPPKIFPAPFTLKNYVDVWNAVPMGRFFWNTLVIVFFGTTLTVLISALAGYPLARFNFRGKSLLFFLLLSTLMLPEEATLLVNFLTCARLGLVNTYAGVFLPSVASVFGIFLLRQAYLSIPREVEDAALIDGCSPFNLWLYVMIPLIAPSLAALAVFAFVGYWNSFLWPLIILTDTRMYPLSVGLTWLSGTFSTNFRLVAAGAILAMIPTLLIFIFLQRYFIKGITAGVGK